MYDELMHYGVGWDDDPPGRGSGRYAHGSGENPGQHQFNFLSEVERMKKKGLKDLEIARALIGKDAKAIDLRTEMAVAKNELRKINYARAYDLYQQTGSYSEVARRMGKNESTIRSILDPVRSANIDRYENTANKIRQRIDEHGLIDLSSGQELFLGVSADTKKVAMKMLEKEGYHKYYLEYEQLGTGNKTTVMVMAKPDITYGQAVKMKGEIKGIEDYSPDQGKTWWVPEFPTSLDSKRVKVRYAEEGGKEKDGVIELRKGVEDISLDGSQYAQVRIAVDGTHYMKGMAIYGDDKDFPPGVDVIFNTNKHEGTPLIGEKDHEVLKRLKINKDTGEVDRNNPFGAAIKGPKDRDGVVTPSGQRHYTDKNGKDQLSPINKLQDEGDWDSWSRNLSAQFLSKQPLKLINQQMKISIADKKDELSQIMELTNPVIKKKLLEDFAGSCDSNAADLSVKGFRKQAFQVLLPVPNIKPDEIYAPNFKDGDQVAVVRYPHGGIFEIPVLKVNNRSAAAKKIFSEGLRDAVGIHSDVAEQLSGADFDGDTGLIIPMASNNLGISHRKALSSLKNWDPKELYKLPDSAPEMNSQTKQTEMGKITNLITDMTVGGADFDQISRAVKHSMVVIDAEKHHLDYKKSFKDQNIGALKQEWQGSESSGASTVLSKAGSEVWVDKRYEVTDTKVMTPSELKRWNEGKRVYRNTPRGRTEPITRTSWKQIKDPKKMTPEELEIYNSGRKVYRDMGQKIPQEKVERMYLVDDAMELVHNKDNPKEIAYANYANNLKSLANQARKEARSMTPYKVDTQAKKTYAREVQSLNEKLAIAEMNAPRERQAQAMAGVLASDRIKSNPDIDYEHKQRIRAQALNEGRAAVGAKKDPVNITDKEWEAIQAHAISSDRLGRILKNTDQDKFRQRATPRRNKNDLTVTQIGKLRAMASSGMYTQQEIAEALGVSSSTVSQFLAS